MALMQELRSAFSFVKQVNLATPASAAELWTLRQTSRNVPQPVLISETDADWMGKGLWVTQVFPTSWDVTIPWEARLTSENFVQCAAFALGKATPAAVTGGAGYIIVPWDQNLDCLRDMPTATWLAYLASCSETVVDYALIGVACEEFTVALNMGPGLDNATISSTWVGTGRFAHPAGIAIPAFATEHSLRAGGSSITVMGVDYVANHKFMTCNWGYKNNIKLDQGFYPGSGSQNNASVRGRMRRGVPAITFNYTAEFEHDSNELDFYLNQTEGAAVLKVEGQVIGAGPAKHMFNINMPRVMFSAAVVGENDNTLTIAMEVAVLQHPGTGEVVTITANTSQVGILAASAATPLTVEGEEMPPEEEPVAA